MSKKKKIANCYRCGQAIYKGYVHWCQIKPLATINQPKVLEDIITEMEQLEHSIIATKGKEYTQQSEDRAKNFKGAAEDLDIPILKVWWVYFKKHIDSILSYVREEKTYCGENIENRVADAVNYLHLLIYIIRQRSKK